MSSKTVMSMVQRLATPVRAMPDWIVRPVVWAMLRPCLSILTSEFVRIDDWTLASPTAEWVAYDAGKFCGVVGLLPVFAWIFLAHVLALIFDISGNPALLFAAAIAGLAAVVSVAGSHRLEVVRWDDSDIETGVSE